MIRPLATHRQRCTVLIRTDQNATMLGDEDNVPTSRLFSRFRRNRRSLVTEHHRTTLHIHLRVPCDGTHANVQIPIVGFGEQLVKRLVGQTVTGRKRNLQIPITDLGWFDEFTLDT